MGRDDSAVSGTRSRSSMGTRKHANEQIASWFAELSDHAPRGGRRAAPGVPYAARAGPGCGHDGALLAVAHHPHRGSARLPIVASRRLVEGRVRHPGAAARAPQGSHKSGPPGPAPTRSPRIRRHDPVHIGTIVFREEFILCYMRRSARLSTNARRARFREQYSS